MWITRGSSYAAMWLLFAIIAASGTANPAGALYWFQSGAFGGSTTEFNNGVSGSIQSVWQNITDGSLGFWVGENLNNGAFIQVGYQIVNSTGDYPKDCNISGCSGTTYLTAGKPTWFWEYFPASYSGTSFLGGIGPDGSAGANGTFNTYSISSSGTVWSAYFNGRLLGSIDLGTAQSGTNPPTAVAEVAAAHGNGQTMQRVQFKNLAYYTGSGPVMVSKGYEYISYGKGSDMALSNPYGVLELSNLVNYFQVGSGLPQLNRSVLWNLGYSLTVVSRYGNLSEIINYSAFSTATIKAPRYVNISSGARAAFSGWVGTGINSYTGAAQNATLTMSNNITETAQWTLQYYVRVNSTYAVSGAGWHNANSTVLLYPNRSVISVANGSRIAFVGWSNGAKANTTKISVTSPQSITAFWAQQYLVSAGSPYGTVHGTGWYNANSIATLSLSNTTAQANDGTRLAFAGWSNGYVNSTVSFAVAGPVALQAGFGRQYIVSFMPKDYYGNEVSGVTYYNVNSANVTGPVYLFANRSQTIDYIYYKGTAIRLNYTFALSAPRNVSFTAPIYNVSIGAVSLFGSPLNASVNVTFDNGTRFVGYLGKAGSVSFNEVPYGAVSGYVEYTGIKRSVQLGGGSVEVLMVSPGFIAAVAIAIVAVVLSARFIRSRRATNAQQQ